MTGRKSAESVLCSERMCKEIKSLTFIDPVRHILQTGILDAEILKELLLKSKQILEEHEINLSHYVGCQTVPTERKTKAKEIFAHVKASRLGVVGFQQKPRWSYEQHLSAN